MTVLAYSDSDNFFHIETERGDLAFYNSDAEVIWDALPTKYEDGKYFYDNPEIEDISYFIWYQDWHNSLNWTFPYNPLVYDYYLLGTMTASDTTNDLSTFKPRNLDVAYRDYDSNEIEFLSHSGLTIYDIDTRFTAGFGFYTKLDFSSANNVGISEISFYDDKDGVGKKPANLVFEVGILAVEKGSSEDVILSQILDQLEKMESSLSYSIGSAADQVAGAIENQYAMSEFEDFGVGQIADQVEEKLGVLTFGVDTLHNFLDLFSAENVGGTQLTFPAFQIEVQGVSYNVWQDITFDLSFLEEHFGVLITAVRTVTVLCVWLAVLGYLVKAKDHFINNRG